MEAAGAQSSLAFQFVETIFEDLGYNLKTQTGMHRFGEVKKINEIRPMAGS